MLMRTLIDLCEGLAQGGILYHATDVMSAARILDADEIQARTDHMINREVSKPGVSLTRSFRFAVDWKRFGVIFALNGSRLRTRSKLIPMDYYQDRRENEEFLVGAIKSLSNVLTGIFITPETEAYCREHDADMIAGDYEVLLNHPLLKIMPFPKSVPYHNPRKPGTGMFDQSSPN
jgi:hypothetical protein